MKRSEMYRLGLKRFLIVLAISALFVGILSEISHFFLRSETDREPQVIELVIPAGTAEKIAEGGSEPSIPDSMVFVVGDTLLVRNDDVVDHQLGPIWVPAHSTGSMTMEEVNSFDLSCSFSASQYFGLDVRERTTIGLRLIGLLYVTPATALFLFVYSLAAFPLKPAKKGATPAGENKAAAA